MAIARRCGDDRRAAWSLGLLGRALVLRDEREEAAAVLDESLALVDELRWIAFQPWPEAWRAEVWLRQGEPDRAGALLEHAFALGCRLGDPCWEAVSARVHGPGARGGGRAGPRAGRAARRGRPRGAGRGSVRLDPRPLPRRARAASPIADGAPDARDCVARLERLAARGDLRELVVRAALHRARLGDPGGVAPARLLAEAIDNPALHAELAAAA